MSPTAENRRPDNLALLFQDVLTAIVRLRANRQGVTDANAFRHHTREALKTAASQALAAGYTADDTRHATFAAVAFLDESVLNSQNPIFGEWLRKPGSVGLPRGGSQGGGLDPPGAEVGPGPQGEGDKWIGTGNGQVRS